MSTGTWRWAPVLLPSVAEPKPITWPSGQEGYSHCFWCWRELRVGDWMWGCAGCHLDNLECAAAFRRGQGLREESIKELVHSGFHESEKWLPIWTPAYDVVPP